MLAAAAAPLVAAAKGKGAGKPLRDDAPMMQAMLDRGEVVRGLDVVLRTDVRVPTGGNLTGCRFTMIGARLNFVGSYASMDGCSFISDPAGQVDVLTIREDPAIPAVSLTAGPHGSVWGQAAIG